LKPEGPESARARRNGISGTFAERREKLGRKKTPPLIIDADLRLRPPLPKQIMKKRILVIDVGGATEIDDVLAHGKAKFKSGAPALTAATETNVVLQINH